MMGRKRLLWQLYPSYLIIILASLLASGWYISHSLSEILQEAVSSTAPVDEVLTDVYIRIAVSGAVIAFLAAILGLWILRGISKPIEEIKHGAELFAKGELRYKMIVPDSLEIGALAETMNKMAEDLDSRIATVTRQRNELEAVLSSMTEGVLALDTEQNFISLNKTAAKLLNVNASAIQGRNLRELVRNPKMQQFAELTLHSDETVDDELTLRSGNEEKLLMARGAGLRDGQNNRIGILIVLTDITGLRHLENVRKDFVANVSHELKTPVTSIKGFVETLLDGAMNNPDDARRFLEVIARQANRLHAIIEDLLILSKLEQETEKAEIVFGTHKIKSVLTAAIQLCEVRATAKNITINFDCADDLETNVNEALLEQAVVNLIDNAIKYSEPQSGIELCARRENGEALISVTDHGCGVEEKYLSRLFERFYRVDKARSRKLGGTGLGLAIVKHICQAHNGYVTVESKVGQGSKFTIHLPV